MFGYPFRSKESHIGGGRCPVGDYLVIFFAVPFSQSLFRSPFFAVPFSQSEERSLFAFFLAPAVFAAGYGVDDLIDAHASDRAGSVH